MPSAPPHPLLPWIEGYAVRLGSPLTSPTAWVTTASGAELAFVGGLVVKLHHPRTDVAELRTRLALATDPALAGYLVLPVSSEVAVAPDGRAETAWPRVEVLDPADAGREGATVPWADAGRLLAGLHRARPLGSMPVHGGWARLRRAVVRAEGGADVDPRLGMVAAAGQRVLAGLDLAAADPASRPDRPLTVVHGDWHLGQLGRVDGAWRLLDLDDLGWGDPAWDLARPAGFWAAGLLSTDDWEGFLAAYRAAGGPGVPVTGDPWPALDLPARAAVVIAATRAVGAVGAVGARRSGADTHSDHTAEALLDACRKM